VVGTAIDILVDFAISGFRIEVYNKELQLIVDYLNENINSSVLNKDFLFAYPSGLFNFSKEIAFEWFISGNVFPFSEWKKTRVKGKSYTLPYKIINLNPQSIAIERYNNFTGATRLTYFPGGVVNDSSVDMGISVKNNSSILEETGGSNLGGLMGLLSKESKALDHRFVYHIKRKASGYRLWGVPYLTKIFTAVQSKRKLRYLDDQTIEGLVNYLVVFKIGSQDIESPYHIVDSSRISAFKALIENPNASNMLVWPHDLQIETVGPDGKIMEFKERYDIVDRDIMRSLGVPSALLDGSGSGNVNIMWVSVLSLVERIETVRHDIENYLRVLIKSIADANELAFNSFRVKWKPSNLRDEKTIKTLLLAFYDRGLFTN
jgi:hypothetical protein